MAILPTGVLSGSWSQSALAQGYYVDIYKDELHHDSFTLIGGGNTSFYHTGFSEGESGFARVRSYSGTFTSSNFIETGHKYFYPENFHTTSGVGLSIEDFSINNTNINAYLSTSGYIASGTYDTPDIQISFDLKTPRDNNSVTEFHVEPFISSGQYLIYSGNQNQFNKNLLSNKFTYKNSTGPRDLYSKIIINDYYQKSITGIVHLNKVAPKIKSITTRLIDYTSSQSGYGVSGKLILFPQISGSLKKINYYFSYDTDFTGFFKEASTENLYNYNASIPLGTGVYVKAIPEDFLGDGDPFYYTGNLSKPTGITPSVYNHKIDSFSVQTKEGYENISFSTFTKSLQKLGDYASGVRSSTLQSGYYYNISVDPSSTGYLNSDSYFTGSMYGDTGFSFNLFNERTSSQEAFYSTLKLHKSGEGSKVYSSRVANGQLPYPKLTSTGYSLNYLNGITTFSFGSNFPSGASYLKYIISGLDQSSYTGDLSLNSFTTGARDSLVNIKLVKSADNSFIYDQQTIQSTGVQPELFIYKFQLADLDGTIPISFQNQTKAEATGIHLFRKSIIKHLTGVSGVSSEPFSSTFSGITEVTPSSENLIAKKTDFSQHYDRAISSISPTIAYTGHNETGGLFYYNSGNLFQYMAIPYNAYGSGSSENILSTSFPFNAFTEDIRVDTNSNITEISTVSSDVSSTASNIKTTGATLYASLSGTANTIGNNISTTGATLYASLSGTANTIGNNISSTGAGLSSSLQSLSGVSLFTTGYSQNITGNLSIGPLSQDVLFEVHGTGSYINTDLTVTGKLNVGPLSENVLFEVHGTGSHINTDLNISGKLNVTGRVQIGGSSPSTSTDSGSSGQLAYDENYFYVCTGTNKWGRVEISNW